jgi:hypothetical protein
MDIMAEYIWQLDVAVCVFRSYNTDQNCYKMPNGHLNLLKCSGLK